MPLPRTQLDEMLDGLEAALPRMVAEHPDDESFWPLFCGNADAIESSASEDDHAHVGDRLNRMLQAIGKVRPAESGRGGAYHG